jgi:hypothetical protein
LNPSAAARVVLAIVETSACGTGCPPLPGAAFLEQLPENVSMPGHLDHLLQKMGQSLRPMSEAPKDGRWILAQSASGLVVCHWDREPSNLAGPSWTEANDATRGYLDDYFTGWIEPSALKLWDYATLADLLIAFVDDAHEAGDEKVLSLLKGRLKLR